MALNFRDTFGAIGDGSTPCGAALVAALDQLGAGLYVPAGRYVIDRSVVQTLLSPDLPTGFSIFGDGDGASVFIFPEGDNIELIQTNARQALTVRGISFVTAKSAANNKSALKLSSSGVYAQPAQSLVSGVTFTGLHGGAVGDDYWAIGIEVVGWECINFNSVNAVGSKRRGVGSRIAGTSGSKYGILYNYSACLLDYCNEGILYDGWVQGVTVSGGCNFNQCTKGIHTPATAMGELAQLVVSDSQFDCSRYAIWTETAVGGLHVHDTEVFIRAGMVGINVTRSLFVNIHDNLLLGPGGVDGQGAQGMHIGGPVLGGMIGSNMCSSLNFAGVFDVDTSGIRVTPNCYYNSGKFLDWSAPGNNSIPASETV